MKQLDLLEEVMTPLGQGTITGYDGNFVEVMLRDVHVTNQFGIYERQRVLISRDEVTVMEDGD